MGKHNLLILGDSYSTYSEAIPKGNLCYYDAKRENFKSYNINSFDDTWVGIFLKKTNCNLILNESYSGSTIANRGYEGIDSMVSFIRRLYRCEDQGLFENGKVDTVIVMGGTNDSWSDNEIGEVMYGKIDGNNRLNVIPGMSYLIDRLKNTLKIKNILFVINADEIKDVIQDKYVEVLNYHNIPYVKIHNFSKINHHPDGNGMVTIANTVSEIFNRLFD